MLILTKVIDPQAHPWLILEPALQDQQELVEIVLPRMADEDIGRSNLIAGGGHRCCGLCLASEQLTIGEADPSMAIA